MVAEICFSFVSNSFLAMDAKHIPMAAIPKATTVPQLIQHTAADAAANINDVIISHVLLKNRFPKQTKP